MMRRLFLSESIFTTIRIVDFNPVWIEDHVLRLKKGADILAIPFDEEVLIKSVIAALLSNTIPNARMRIILNKDGGYEINFEPFSDHLSPLSIRFKEIEPQGSLKIWPFRKHTEKSDEEVVLIDKNSGNILEGSYTNIFVKKGSDFFTPPDDGKILPGICRKYFIEYLKLKGCCVKEERFNKEFMIGKEIFLTNALRGVIKTVIS
jgi:branched-subunit amino acid aminotransferase/4-amino-4-deoxychorismate lyase